MMRPFDRSDASERAEVAAAEDGAEDGRTPVSRYITARLLKN